MDDDLDKFLLELCNLQSELLLDFPGRPNERESTDHISPELINIPNAIGLVPLHQAVQENDMKKIEYLLNQPNIDVNYKNKSGQTPLMLSNSLYRSDALILQLLRAGCDPNIPDKYNETPLHTAVIRPDNTIMHELIKCGANINAQSKEKLTPLHFAVQYNNVEAVCLLLYYGAETYVLSKNNMTPFTYALSYNLFDISKILVNYYCSDIDDSSNALFWALRSTMREIPEVLIEMGADVNYITAHKETLVQYTLKYKDSQLFKLMWSKCDEEIIANARESLLWYCLFCCHFPTEQWLECLHLILASPFAHVFIRNCCFYTEGISTVVGDFLSLPRTYSLVLKDRLGIIYNLLKVQTGVCINDIKIAYDIYGYSDELEALIYFFDYKDLTQQEYSDFNCCLIPFILGKNDDEFNINKLLEDRYFDDKARNIIKLSRFFSKSYYKSNLDGHTLLLLHTSYKHEAEIIQSVSEVPSLIEISRDRLRKYIKNKYQIDKPYQFLDIIKCLPLPRRIKDILLFKVSIY